MGEHREVGEPHEQGERQPPPGAIHAVEIVEFFNGAYTDNASASASVAYPDGRDRDYAQELNLAAGRRPMGDGNALRAEIIEKYLPVLQEAGLSLATTTDTGFDDRGRRPALQPGKPLPLAAIITDAEKFSQTLDTYGDRNVRTFVGDIVGQTVGVIRAGYNSENSGEAAGIKHLLSTMATVVPDLEQRDPINSPRDLAGIKQYLAREAEGTLGDYLGAEQRDMVTIDRDAQGPGSWHGDLMFKPLYSPEEVTQKWQTALSYLQELQGKQSPLFAELFSGLREEFDHAISWLNSPGGQFRENTPQMLAALEAVNPLWTQYFDEANAMHDLDKDLEAARMADYAMRFGLDPDQVPELEAEVNTVSMEVARDLLRDQAQRLFKTAGQLPDHQSVSQQAVRTEPDTDMRHSLKNLPDRSQVWYHKDKKIKGEIITPQVEVHLSRSTNGAFILDKEVSRLADGANGLGMRLQAVIDDDGIRARVQNAHLAGQTHFDHQLSPAESIQAAEAMMAHLQGEAAPWESPES